MKSYGFNNKIIRKEKKTKKDRDKKKYKKRIGEKSKKSLGLKTFIFILLINQISHIS